MIKQSTEPTYLSRGMDYLGELGARLRDLQGYTTLAYELIQNAEDSKNATWISFDIRHTGLIVDNDGTFTDCGNVEEAKCPWETDGTRGYLCDFHGFRVVAAGHKRELKNTIGAFGVGFTSVYQITDTPHLISRGRHWIIHEEKDEEHRIMVCPGCAECNTKQLPGTRFILPWATDVSSELRTRLRADAVKSDAYEKFPTELSESLPDSLLFLQHLAKIRILKDGKIQTAIERKPLSSGFIIHNGKSGRQWFVFRGNFDDAAKELKRKHIGRIESKRSSEVAIAIPAEPLQSGLLFAFLPSQHKTGVGFHINADFYPASDRKRINFEAGYELEWNLEALRAAAVILSENLSELPETLGHKQFWSVINSCYDVSINKRDRFFSEFWKTVQPELKTADVVYTSTKLWKAAEDCRVTREDAEKIALPLLERMGINLADENLKPYFNALRSLGVGLVDVSDITNCLISHGLTRRLAHRELPSWIRSKESLAILWKEIALLLRRTDKKARKEAEQKLLSFAIAPSVDGELWPFRDIYRADEKTVALFRKIDPSISFLDKRPPEVDEVLALIPRFSAQVAVEKLSKLGAKQIVVALGTNKDLLGLLRWFELNKQEVLASPSLRKALSDLPIFPTASGPKSLSKLSLPGGFTDPLGLANLVDVNTLEGRIEFLSDLDAQKLTFEQYVLVHIPETWANEPLTTETKQQVVELIAVHFGEIRDNKAIKNSLGQLDLVQCTDGNFRRPADVYFSNEIVNAVLGPKASCAQLPNKHTEAISDLYAWLGTLKEPDLADVISRVEAVTSAPADGQGKAIIDTCVNYLGDLFSRESFNKELFHDLKTLRWLPARSDNKSWYQPEEVYTLFREILFSSQATFLGLSAVTQRSNADFLRFIGVPSEPVPRMVVKHLDYCATNKRPVKMDVYTFLNEHVDDSSVVSLKDKPCLLLADHRYESPDKVFWGPHPFGRMRIQLSPDWRKYNNLLTALGVKESPDATDAIKIISEVAEEFGRDNRPLEGWACSALLQAWAILDSALQANEIQSDHLSSLRDLKVIPNVENVLQKTEGVLFEDRSGLAGKFGSFLTTSAIPRPTEGWRAMAAAGVRTLSEAVKVEVIECDDPVPDLGVMAVLHRRSKELARVLDAHMNGQDPQSLRKLLQQIRCDRVAALTIRFAITAFKQVRHSPPENVPALYDVESATMYFVQQGDRIPWPSIARELALAVFPEEEPGRLAPGFKEVLSAESDEVAVATLNELGFANVLVVSSTADSEEITGVLGAEESDDEFPDVGESVLSSGASIPDERMTPDEAAKQILGDLAQPSALPPELDKPEFASGSQVSTQSNGGAGTQMPSRKQGRLRSYVVKNGDKTTVPDTDSHEQRTEVDKAGIRCVKRFEEAQGRTVDIKPHAHEGYDIESMDSDGNILRYIEVKSLSGVWGTRGVPVHRSQFKSAQKLRMKYWLYVVENAVTDDPKIYRILDPAEKVDDFLFDYDWHEIAEKDNE